MDWEQRRGQIKHLLYELALSGRISKELFMVQLYDLNNVEPIVRCKDCKYHEDEEIGMVWCPYFIGSWVKNDFHCAIGERRDEVEE